MKRRSFIKNSLIGSAGLLTLSCDTARLKSERPNIFFAIADDWGWPHSPVYGDGVVKTPTFDRVAKNGVLFNCAFVSSPSCTPSRNAILTGQYHWRLGTGANLWSVFPEGQVTYPNILEDNGYFVGSYRKAFGPGKDNPRPVAGKRFESVEEFFAVRPKDRPFCFWFGSSDPHRPYTWRCGVEGGLRPEQVRVPSFYPDAEEIRTDICDYYWEVERFDREVGEALDLIENIGELDNTIIVITGDNGWPFPRGKANLYDRGVRVPLAIQWKNGIRRSGRTVDDFVSLSDLAPTFLQAAGVEIPEAMTGKSLVEIFRSRREGVVESEYRAFVLCGKERHVPAQEGHMGGYPCRAIRTRDYLYIRNFRADRWPAGTPNFEKAAISGAWLADCDNSPTKTCICENRDKDEDHRRFWDLSFGKRPEEELYDCRKDPEQVVNVADNPDYAEIKSKLAALLFEHLDLTGDPRASGGGDQFDEYPYLGGAPKHPSAER